MYPLTNSREKSEHVRAASEWSTFDLSELPRSLCVEDSIIQNERDFHTMLVLSKRVQRRLGWSAIANSTCFYPDLSAVLIGGGMINIELEYRAERFLSHRSPWACDLVLSFARKDHNRVINGVVVWSLYKDDGDGLVWTLDDDIRNNGDILGGFGFNADEVTGGAKRGRKRKIHEMVDLEEDD